MNKQLSIYLDILRFCAAIMVFISHVPSFSGGWLWQFSGLGHEAVVIFFVLSGFVIAYVVFEKEESALQYVTNRVSRIYSVAIPALIITVLLYYVGKQIDKSAFIILDERLQNPVWTIISALSFTNQSWIASPTFLNLPYWSLGYEVLYYAFFGILMYMKGRTKIAFLCILALIMGPSILLYLPIWFFGVICFKNLHAIKLTFKASLLIYLVSIGGFITVSIKSVQLFINTSFQNIIGSQIYEVLLEPADKFASDYILAIFVSIHIFSSFHLAVNSKFCMITKKLESIIRELSSHTFSLYLMHMPLLYFISIIVPYESNQLVNLLFCWLFIPFIIYLLSSLIEKNKYRLKKSVKNYLNNSLFLIR
ncbi:acyltransferase [Thalassotalea sp. M1531]|uniref:Acyltransferase n=1 Tax=Thalassotalea algicola TaxID=2716224 RepID=A0A7Y0LF83_9GAMM|nr:acyltransferase [Thalassotalea algicola]NMP33057.1 acyltransferase [Thalassotalea algicola]